MRMLRFNFVGAGANLNEVQTTIGTNGQDAIQVFCDADGAGVFTLLGNIDWLDGVNGPLLSGAPAFEIPTPCVSATTRLALRVHRLHRRRRPS